MRYFFLWCFLFSAAHASVLIEDAAALQLFSEGKSWLVLGFVSDSEKMPIIDTKGVAYRRDTEKIIQKQGGSIFSLSLSERTKLERIWSLPFTGRLDKKLLAFADENKINIVAGSFPAHAPEDITVLCYDHVAKKSLVWYGVFEKESRELVGRRRSRVAAEDMSKESAARRSNSPLDYFKTIEPTRQRPEERLRRRSGNNASSARALESLRARLEGNAVLADFKKSFEGKDAAEIKKSIDSYLYQAESSWVSSTKIEMLSRAYILCVKAGNRESLGKTILARLNEHEAFYNDPDTD